MTLKLLQFQALKVVGVALSMTLELLQFQALRVVGEPLTKELEKEKLGIKSLRHVKFRN